MQQEFGGLGAQGVSRDGLQYGNPVEKHAKGKKPRLWDEAMVALDFGESLCIHSFA